MTPYEQGRVDMNKKMKNLKTYKERAKYMSFINPHRADVYGAIADFFGEDEIPPLMKVPPSKP